MPKVFISYSHDSDEHRQRVLSLSDQLRADGVDCYIDQYVNGWPDDGWQRWMEKQIELAVFVLVVCTPLYLRRFRGEDLECGRGVNFEGVIISQVLYDAFQQNTKFIPVIPDNGSLDNVPLILKSGSAYLFGSQYEALYRVLTDQPRATAKQLGSLKSYPTLNDPQSVTDSPTIHSDRLPTVKGGIFGRKAELKLLTDAWQEKSPTRIIQFIAPGGTGKTMLLRHWLDHTADIPVLIAWSFYSQGASEDKQTSATPFFTHAFEKLGSTRAQFASEEDKGDHLAELLHGKRYVLVLDGLEPLQHGGAAMRGELKDRAIRQLLRQLARHPCGLCIITTRIALHELSDRDAPTLIRHDLQNLAPADGIKLLKSLGVHANRAVPASKDTDLSLLKSLGIPPTEYQLYLAVCEYGCHALALSLLGNAVRWYLEGDILRRDTILDLNDGSGPLEHHAVKVMRAYETWLAGTAELKVLYLLGLFDHPIDQSVLDVLLQARIPGLTAAPQPKRGWLNKWLGKSKPATLSPQEQREWSQAVRALREEHHLLSQHEGGGFDCHPLIREYFGNQLQAQQPQAWQQAHARLYEYYKALPEHEIPNNSAEMEQLFSSVKHGCAAKLHKQVLDKVFWPRINRKNKGLLENELGRISDRLAVISHFFVKPWQILVEGLSDPDKAYLLSSSSLCLLALGRLREAEKPMQASIDYCVGQKEWVGATINSINLGLLQLILGNIEAALINGHNALMYENKFWNRHWGLASLTSDADVLHQTTKSFEAHLLFQIGHLSEALLLFQDTETFQQTYLRDHPYLSGQQGFYYCELLLEQREVLSVFKRVKWTIQIAIRKNNLLEIALDQLTLGRAYLQQEVLSSSYSFILEGQVIQQAAHCLGQAVEGLRAAGQQDHLPRGLLARAELHRHTHDFACARPDLQEVFDIADGSGMRLFLTDYHLEMARLLLAEEQAKVPIIGQQNRETLVRQHLEAARQLIKDTGYMRRQSEWQALQNEVAVTVFTAPPVISICDAGLELNPAEPPTNDSAMPPTQNGLPLKLIEERRERLENKLSRLYAQYDLETRIEEKLRLESVIADTLQQLKDL